MIQYTNKDGLFYASKGTGEKILWLHGYTLDHSIWSPILDAFSEYSHISLDLPGHGKSRSWKDNENLSDIGKEIGSFALEQGCDHIVAISLGGMIALQIAIEFPHSFKSLIVNAASLGGGIQDYGAKVKNQKLRSLFSMKGKHDELDALWLQSPPDIFKGAETNNELFMHLKTLVANHKWIELGTSNMAYINNYIQSEAAMSKITANTLILIGEADMVSFKRTAEIIRRSIKGSERYYLPDCGHLALLEQPVLCIPIIKQHLKKERIIK